MRSHEFTVILLILYLFRIAIKYFVNFDASCKKSSKELNATMNAVIDNNPCGNCQYVYALYTRPTHIVYLPDTNNVMHALGGLSQEIYHTTGPSKLHHLPSSSTSSHPSPRQWRMANIINADHQRLLNNLYLNRELDRLV